MKEKLMSMLDVLAEKLGTTTELLWSVLVKQAEIESYIWLSWLLAWLFLFSILVLIFIKAAYTGKKQNWEMWGCWYIGVTASICIGITVIAFCYSQYLIAAYNPEYWALNEILSTFGK